MNSNPLDVLRKARKLIADNELATGNFYEYTMQQGPGGFFTRVDAFCSLGAVISEKFNVPKSKLNDIHPLDEEYPYDRAADEWPEIQALYSVLPQEFHKEHDTLDTSAECIYRYNDRRSTGKEGVLALFDRAIEHLEEKP